MSRDLTKPNSDACANGWASAEVAAAQAKLVQQQLQHPERVAPFVQFQQALAAVQPLPGSLLDVGCGCGHYGLFCSTRYRLHYYGTDASPAMIDQARALYPNGTYRVCAFEENWFESFPLILIGQVMEYTPDPWLSLGLLLSKLHGHAILHRLRRTEEPSHRTALEATYCGNYLQNYAWNLAEVRRFIAGKAEVVYGELWEGNLTMVVKR